MFMCSNSSNGDQDTDSGVHDNKINSIYKQMRECVPNMIDIQSKGKVINKWLVDMCPSAFLIMFFTMAFLIIAFKHSIMMSILSISLFILFMCMVSNTIELYIDKISKILTTIKLDNLISHSTIMIILRNAFIILCFVFTMPMILVTLKFITFLIKIIFLMLIMAIAMYLFYKSICMCGVKIFNCGVTASD